MRITTVLLDAGGIILDEAEHEDVRVAIAVEVLQSVAAGYSAGMLYADLDEAINLFCPRVLAYAFWKRVKPDKLLFDDLWRRFRDEWGRRRPPLRLMGGFESEIRSISGAFQVGIAGQYGRDLLTLLDEHDLLKHFTHHFTQDDFEITKPDPRYLEQVARACGAEPNQCIMVGDRVDNDIIPAKQLGMMTVLVRVGLHRHQEPRTPEEMPDAELTGIGGLARAIMEIASTT